MAYKCNECGATEEEKKQCCGGDMEKTAEKEDSSGKDGSEDKFEEEDL